MRINLWGGPGSGKSTVTAYVFSQLSRNNYNVEIINEYVKQWAYLDRQPKSFDQIYIFGKQLHAEDVILQSGVSHLITDSPLLMSAWYCRKNSPAFWQHILALASEFEKAHPSIDIFLDRSGIKYQQRGRFQNEEEAATMDRQLFEFVTEYCPNVVRIKTIEPDAIVAHICSKLEDK